MLLTIKKVQDGSFTGDEGAKIEYYWTKAETTDGTNIRFGGKVDYSNQIGDTIELNVEKIEYSNGKKGYKEVYED